MLLEQDLRLLLYCIFPENYLQSRMTLKCFIVFSLKQASKSGCILYTGVHNVRVNMILLGFFLAQPCGGDTFD